MVNVQKLDNGWCFIENLIYFVEQIDIFDYVFFGFDIFF